MILPPVEDDTTISFSYALHLTTLLELRDEIKYAIRGVQSTPLLGCVCENLEVKIVYWRDCYATLLRRCIQ